MAKKQQELNSEGILELALVPESEWPYDLPDNWVWIRLPFAYDNLTSGSKKLKQKDYLKHGSYAVVDQGRELVGGYTEDKDLLFDGELPIILFGDHTRIIKYIDFPFVQGADGVKILKPKPYFVSKCFFYLLQSVAIPDLGYRRHTPLFQLLSCALPPLAEQQRIINRVESLFGKLDQAKELIQEALDTFETRKAAILHQAFTGELTKKWRQENSVGMDDWKECQLSDVCVVNPKKADINGLPDELAVTFVPMPAVSDVLGIIEAPQERMLGEVKTGYTNFSENDVIFAKITPCMENGKSAIVGKLTNDIGFGSTEFHVLRCSDKLNKYYLYHMLRSQRLRDEAKAVMTGAVGQQRVPKTFLENYPINLPQKAEQEEIVRIVNGLFEKELKAKELYDVIDQIELLKKTILARAFRGELGTNDPTEESALELLKEVLVS